MIKLKILLDMDDVMIDFLQRWVEVVNKKYNKTAKYTDIYCWSMHCIYPELTHDEIFNVLYKDEFWANVLPKYGAVKYIRRLIEDGHEIYVVTASCPKTMMLKQTHVLKKYFPFIPHENIIMAHNKQMVIGDILIDDNPKNLIGGTYKGILMTAPHNKQYPVRLHGWNRVNSWDEIYELISNMLVVKEI